MKRGRSTKEIWLRAKGEMPSFRISPTRAAQESKRHGTPQPSQCSQQADHVKSKSSVGILMHDNVLYRA
jgi:hypothetical protein